jgi:hypothetical protein
MKYPQALVEDEMSSMFQDGLARFSLGALDAAERAKTSNGRVRHPVGPGDIGQRVPRVYGDHPVSRAIVVCATPYVLAIAVKLSPASRRVRASCLW